MRPIRCSSTVVLALLLGKIGLITLYAQQEFVCRETLPDFAAYVTAAEKKDAFFAYMTPRIALAQQEILDERFCIEVIRDRLSEGIFPSSDDVALLRELAARYGIRYTNLQDLRFFEKLLIRVDLLPASMILAQAAHESGWGTSRFAVEGNNLFGIRCWKKGCGIVPRNRPAGEIYESKGYASPIDSIRDYLYQINTHEAYMGLRQTRAILRSRNLPLSGDLLISGIERYSERGNAYIADIRSFISRNRLDRFDLDPVY
jgi:Bax protein